MARTCYLCAQFWGKRAKSSFSWATRTLRAVGHTVGRDCFFCASLPIKEFLTPMTKKNSELLLHPLNQRSISACFFLSAPSPSVWPDYRTVEAGDAGERKKEKKGERNTKKVFRPPPPFHSLGPEGVAVVC